MNTEDRIALAGEIWEACRKLLPQHLAEELQVMPGDPQQFEKHSKGSARLRLKPRRRRPTGFWSGVRWYQIHIGEMKPRTIYGEVEFIFGGDGPYFPAVKDIVNAGAAALGPQFEVHPPNYLALARPYKEALIVAKAATDFSEIIEYTLPRFLALPS